MTLFVWTDALASGNDIIDDDHRQLIERVNAVLVCIAKRQPDDQLALVLSELARYARGHFDRTEATLLHQPRAVKDAHKTDRDRFLTQVDATLQQLNIGQPIHAMELYHFLTRWMKDHIFQLDMTLAGAFKD